MSKATPQRTATRQTCCQLNTDMDSKENQEEMATSRGYLYLPGRSLHSVMIKNRSSRYSAAWLQVYNRTSPAEDELHDRMQTPNIKAAVLYWSLFCRKSE